MKSFSFGLFLERTELLREVIELFLEGVNITHQPLYMPFTKVDVDFITQTNPATGRMIATTTSDKINADGRAKFLAAWYKLLTQPEGSVPDVIDLQIGKREPVRVQTFIGELRQKMKDLNELEKKKLRAEPDDVVISSQWTEEYFQQTPFGGQRTSEGRTRLVAFSKGKRGKGRYARHGEWFKARYPQAYDLNSSYENSIGLHLNYQVTSEWANKDMSDKYGNVAHKQARIMVNYAFAHPGVYKQSFSDILKQLKENEKDNIVQGATYAVLKYSGAKVIDNPEDEPDDIKDKEYQIAYRSYRGKRIRTSIVSQLKKMVTEKKRQASLVPPSTGVLAEPVAKQKPETVIGKDDPLVQRAMAVDANTSPEELIDLAAEIVSQVNDQPKEVIAAKLQGMDVSQLQNVVAQYKANKEQEFAQ